jgi:hypothetical protein
MPHRLPATPLYCHADHPDPQKRGATCYSLLGYFPALNYEFVTDDERAPELPGPEDRQLVWLPCPRKNCRRWNAFRILPPADDADVTDDL